MPAMTHRMSKRRLSDRVWACVLLVGAASSPSVAGSSLPTWNDVTFDAAVDRRFNYCSRMQDLTAGKIELRDALRGLQLSVSMPNGATYTPLGQCAWLLRVASRLTLASIELRERENLMRLQLDDGGPGRRPETG